MLSFSLQPSVLALSIMALEIEEQKLLELTEALEFLQLHSKVWIKFSRVQE